MQFSKFIGYDPLYESHKWRDKETFETPEALSDWCQSTYYLITANKS